MTRYVGKHMGLERLLREAAALAPPDPTPRPDPFAEPGRDVRSFETPDGPLQSLDGRDRAIILAALEAAEAGREVLLEPALEARLRRFVRPALLVRYGSFTAPPVGTWSSVLAAARPALERILPAVGRVALENHPSLAWAGTAWVVAPGLVVTNRHVAKEFTGRRAFDGRKVTAAIELGHEYEVPAGAGPRFRVVKAAWIAPERGPDLAFLRTDPNDGPLPASVPLRAGEVRVDEPVATIGYPAADGMRNDATLMAEMFAGIYNVKRLQPGRVLGVEPGVIHHDCTTLGGNSGSVVVSLETGEAVGVHFGGRTGDKNWAVPAAKVLAKLSASDTP